MMDQSTRRTTSELYQKVTAITEEYLGPATERFLTRQIESHLDKSPQELQPSDLPILLKWTRVTLGLLTENRSLINDYVAKMTELIDASPQ